MLEVRVRVLGEGGQSLGMGLGGECRLKPEVTLNCIKKRFNFVGEFCHVALPPKQCGNTVFSGVKR